MFRAPRPACTLTLVAELFLLVLAAVLLVERPAAAHRKYTTVTLVSLSRDGTVVVVATRTGDTEGGAVH